MSEYVSEATSAAWDKEVGRARWRCNDRFLGCLVRTLQDDCTDGRRTREGVYGKNQGNEADTDENPDIASRYKIMGIPTIIFYRNGQEADRIVGAVPGISFLKNALCY